jgi:hypothetical protein
MNRMSLAATLLCGLCITGVANASVTWTFGGNPGLVAQGSAYNTSLGTITVYAEQVNGSGVLQSIPDSTLCSGTNCLFQTNTSVNPDGTGIGPYNPAEGTSGSFSNQDGIDENNILELELGSNIANGTTLSFLLQSGYYAYGADTVSVYTSNTSTVQNLGSMSIFKNSVASPIGGISTTGTTPQFTITKDTSGTEFVAIAADCHYLLLDTITGTAPSAPEPRFYGVLLVGLLGFVGIFVRNRRAAQQTV